MSGRLAWCGLVISVLVTVEGGGRLLEPPMRSSLWRYGYSSDRNYQDDSLNCGGFYKQWKVHAGDCGVCGDEFGGILENEYGGRYARKPIPVRAYQADGLIQVAVEISADAQGYFEFRLCIQNSSTDQPTQACFDKNVLSIVDAKMATRYYPGSLGGLHFMKLKLPFEITCDHCLLQWKHVTGYRFGELQCLACEGGAVNCGRCQGCGEQENFVNCADIAVYRLPATRPALASTVAPTLSTLSSSAQDVCTCPAAATNPSVSGAKDGINSVNN